MAELRSFIIGVTIAGAVLLIAGLSLGLFGDDSSGSPSVRLLGSPVPSRTPPPPATRDPSQITPVAPSPTPAVPAGATGAGTPVGGAPPAGETPAGGQTPIPIATATPTQVAEPTEAPSTPTPEPVQSQAYIDNANAYTTGFSAQVDFLASLSSAAAVGDAVWRNNATVSANDIQTRASALGGIEAPACVSTAHNSLVSAANQASAAAGNVLAGIDTQDGAAVSGAAGGLTAASGAIAGAVSQVITSLGSC